MLEGDAEALGQDLGGNPVRLAARGQGLQPAQRGPIVVRPSGHSLRGVVGQGLLVAAVPQQVAWTGSRAATPST